MQVNMLEAKSQLSKLVKAALDGEEVVIANHGRPVVRLVKLLDTPTTCGFGAWKDAIELSEDWDSPATNSAIASPLREASLFPQSRRSPRAAQTAARRVKARKSKAKTPR